MSEKAVPHGAPYDQPGDAYCIATHAEMNALLYADPLHLTDASIYITIEPCKWCKKVIANTPIRRIVYPGPEPGSYKVELV
jgi:deoxycytidylate deaminase